MACRGCGSADLVEVIDLGDQALVDFRTDDETPPEFPLRLLVCERCLLAQLDTTVARELMYHDRYGFKSGVNDTIRADHRSIVRQALDYQPDCKAWLDIACNDGTLLANVPKGMWREGVDPVAKYAAEAEAHADRVVCGYFDPSVHERRFDVITAISVFYDFDDPNGFLGDAASLLNRGGVLVVQQNYLADMVRLNAVDNICHEHITYLSLTALEPMVERHGLEVVHVDRSMVNGGVFRTVIAHAGTFEPDASVEQTRRFEQTLGLDTLAAFDGFADRCQERLDEIAELVQLLADNRRPVYVYGASTRGCTLLQSAGLDVRQLPFAVDRNPEKVGKTIAPLGIPIISEQEARARNPHFMLVSPWFFRDEFMQRESEWLAAGGRFIFPLPNVEVVTAKTRAAA